MIGIIVPFYISHAVFACVDILAELNEWGPVFTLWSNSEDKLSGSLSGMAKAVEKTYVALQELVSALLELHCHVFVLICM